MREREPRKESIAKGDLFFLWHPDSPDTFSGYGLALYPGMSDVLTGLLMIDRPAPASPEWLDEVQATFGHFHLVPMTATGERGIVCQMEIAPESRPHLRRFPSEKTTAIQQALQPLLEAPPAPLFDVEWDTEAQLWRSSFTPIGALPREIRDVLHHTGYGCLAAETDIGVVHVCHAADTDITGFAGKPIQYQWQLVKMPSAPVIRLEMLVLDQPSNPYQFESFYNVAEKDQMRILDQLANQEQLYLAFYDSGFNHRFTKVVRNSPQQWQYLDDLVDQARAYWASISPEQRDFDLAKAVYIQEATW